MTRDQSQIRRIAYTGALNRSPVANATANPTFGALPLSVQFDGAGSSDPDNDPLTYEWDFQNDGTPDSTAVAPTHQYTTAGVFFAKLTVRDGKGGENSATVRIDAGNTPPSPVIETPSASALFASDQHFILHGSATLDRNLGDAGLIDRYHLLVFPVLLGAGKRLFSDTDKDKQSLKVLESETYGNGIQKLVYEVVR